MRKRSLICYFLRLFYVYLQVEKEEQGVIEKVFVKDESQDQWVLFEILLQFVFIQEVIDWVLEVMLVVSVLQFFMFVGIVKDWLVIIDDWFVVVLGLVLIIGVLEWGGIVVENWSQIVKLNDI